MPGGGALLTAGLLLLSCEMTVIKTIAPHLEDVLMQSGTAPELTGSLFSKKGSELQQGSFCARVQSSETPLTRELWTGVEGRVGWWAGSLGWRV